MVAFMLDMLDPRPGDRMLEIGSGSGYAAAIAALLCGPEGLVYAAEILPELAAAARISCRTCFPGSVFSAAIADRIVFIDGDGSAGFPELGPFDRILLSAGVSSRSFRTEVLLDQLAPGGALLYPERVGGIFLLRKTPDGLLRQQWNSVSFVPLLGRNS
jgi:protein-L-isoaspartate(D-aspartate) O-methyltransferase